MSESNLDENIAALEALLFIHGEALSLKKIGAVLEFDDEVLKAAVTGLWTRLEAGASGLTLISDGMMDAFFDGKGWEDKKIQLGTKPAFAKLVERFIKEQLAEELTPASIETMSVVSYLGPVSRATIEYVRGVNSSFTLRNLMLRGLIERNPDPEHASSFVYRPSFDFLKHMGVRTQEELPDYARLRELLIKLQAPAPASESESAPPQESANVSAPPIPSP
ncbi:MAG: SMC-Scp complex subunit ScpB [bacterium]|nr:SMC-Scp complex subunit ScpB [bacterium]